MKKYISLMLVCIFMMLLSFVPDVSALVTVATGRTEIPASTYTNKHSSLTFDGGKYAAFNDSTVWAEYTVNCEEGGDYYLYLHAGFVRTSAVSVVVNGTEIYTRTMGMTTSASIRKEILLAKITLSEGNNTLRTQEIADKMYLEKLIIEKNPPVVKAEGESVILSRSYSDCYEGLLFEKGYIVLNSESPWVEYTVTAEKGGIYEFYFSAGTVFSVSSIYLIVNGKQYDPKVLLNTTTYDNVTSQFIQNVILNQGINTIRVCLGNAGMYQGDLILKPYNALALAEVPANGETSLNGGICSDTTGTIDGAKLLLAQNESATYNIKAKNEGNVRLSVTLSDCDSNIELCVNDVEKLILVPDETKVAKTTIWLFEGNNILTITAKNGGAIVENLVFYNEGNNFSGDEIKILSYNYDDSSGNLVKEVNHLSFQTNHWTEYHLNVEKKGTYMLYIGISSIYNTDTDMEIVVNGNQSEVAVLEATNNTTFTVDRFATRITLSKGFNTIKVKNLSRGMYFDYLKIKKDVTAQKDIEKIEAENYLYGYNPKESQKVSGVRLSDSYWLKYESEIPQKAFYRISLCGAVSEDTKAYISQNGRLCGTVNLRKSDEAEKHIGFAELEAGNTILKLTLSKGELDLDFFSLAITENVEKEFLGEINSAENGEEIKAIFDDFEDYTGISVEEITDGIFYKDFIFEKILSEKYTSTDDVVFDFLKSVALERSKPAISVLKGGEKSDSLDGNAEFLVIDKARFNNKKTLICSIYQENRLKFIYTDSNYGNEKEIINLKNNNLDFSKPMSLKVMEFDSFDSLHPLDCDDVTRLSIYVSPSGDDSKSGTEAEPLRTLKKAKEKAAEIKESVYGDVIINLLPGTHYISETEIFSNEDSGENGFDLIIKGTDGKNPSVISGGTVVTGFTYAGNGIYKAPFSYNGVIRNLYINNQPAVRAKSSEQVVSSKYDDSSTSQSFDGVVSILSGINTISNPEDCEIVVNTHWAQHRIPVKKTEKSSSGTIIHFDDIVKENMGNLNSYTDFEEGKKFYLENDFSFLDKANEFYFDSNAQMLYYKPDGKTDMAKATVVVPITEGLLKIEGEKDNKVKNIVFDNITFAHSSYKKATDDGLINRQADYFYENGTESYKMEGQITVKNAEGIQFKNCVFTCLGSAAIDIYDGASKVLIEGNVFKNIAGGGIIVGSIEPAKTGNAEGICTDIKISNNVFRNIGFEYFCQGGVSVYYANTVKISHNDFANMPYLGISLGWGWGDEDVRQSGGIEVSNNRIISVMEKLYDGSHIYTLGPIRDTIISENYMETSTCSQFGGLYTDQGSGYMHFKDNVIKNCQNWFFTGLNKTHDLCVYGNMSDSSSYIKRGEDNYYEDAIDISKTMPERATEVYNMSGVEDEFKALLNY